LPQPATVVSSYEGEDGMCARSMTAGRYEETREQWDCTDFFDAMLQAESDFRTDRKTRRRIKAAKFALRPSFEDFDLKRPVSCDAYPHRSVLVTVQEH
jgi:hypothetical protein